MTALEVSGTGPLCVSPATCGRLGIHVSSCPLHPGYAVSAGKKPPCDNCGQIVVGEFQRCTNCHKSKRILCGSCVLCWDCNSVLQQKQSEETWDRWMMDTGSASSLVERSTTGQPPDFNWSSWIETYDKERGQCGELCELCGEPQCLMDEEFPHYRHICWTCANTEPKPVHPQQVPWVPRVCEICDAQEKRV